MVPMQMPRLVHTMDQCQTIPKMQSPINLDYKPATDPSNRKTLIFVSKYFVICPCVEVVK